LAAVVAICSEGARLIWNFVDDRAYNSKAQIVIIAAARALTNHVRIPSNCHLHRRDPQRPKGYDALMEFCEAQFCQGANQPLSFKR
jgi:hypothetical protein